MPRSDLFQARPERVLAGVLLVFLAVGCVFVLLPFLPAIVWAVILAYSTFPVFEWLRTRLRLGRTLAAATMVGITAVCLLLPLAALAPGAGDDLVALQQSLESALAAGLPGPPAWLEHVPMLGQPASDLWARWAGDLSIMAAFFQPYLGLVASAGLKLLLGLAGGVVQFVMALVVAFFLWHSGERLAARLTLLTRRIAGPGADRLLALVGATVRGTVYGILGTAVVQAFLTVFGLWATGVPRPVLLGAVAGFLSVLPVGAPVVWIPAAVWLLWEGHTLAGIGLGVYGGVFISGADSLIRPYFIARGAQLPFILTILGVLGGAVAFGLLGIFVGPVLLGVGFTLVAEYAVGSDPAPPGHSAPLGDHAISALSSTTDTPDGGAEV